MNTITAMSRSERTTVQRQLILDKARMLFWAQGYDKTSVRDLARACDFEVSNIYNYFKSKEQILYHILIDETDRVISTLQHLEKDEITRPTEVLRQFVRSQLHIVLASGQTGLLQDIGLRSLSPAHRKRIIQQRDRFDSILRRIIDKGIATGDFREIDVKIIGMCIVSLITRSRIWFSPLGRLSIDEIADIAVDFILNGLGRKHG